MRRGSRVNQSSQPSLCAQRFAEGVFFWGKRDFFGFHPLSQREMGDFISRGVGHIPPSLSRGLYRFREGNL
jgi:hypothetical protein